MFDNEYEQEYYEEPDYETFERIQLDRDRDMGEFDLGEPVFYDEPFEEFESDLWDDIDESLL